MERILSLLAPTSRLMQRSVSGGTVRTSLMRPGLMLKSQVDLQNEEAS